MNILVSACLLGVNCRYNGMGIFCEELNLLKDRYNLIPVCPEIFGGMKTPREPNEIKEGRVITPSGEDVTDSFKRGAEEVLKLARFYDCKYAILKEHSPSCGCGQIYDGSFLHKIVRGNGITAELLLKNGIRVIGETKIKTLL